MSENTNEVSLPPVAIGFIVDNEVVEILHTEERLANILLSNPLVLNVTAATGRPKTFIGDTYDPEQNKFAAEDTLAQLANSSIFNNSEPTE